ncbi:hypothetical protein [Arcobacter roscoffensis]|uniref:Ubiquitin-activating enzyme E1 FCCH domain-containing protein n=1 Tax=Arcobacter roscoffensis TaxID=2961520 RepID=A0ABY5E0Z5_9BACT|nr:hypothetical protein [Arcobacter roscoffensis]UTJ05385.1 hypothetical protein NJU99_08900 [Arcobacter roscoffensis]
MTQIPIINKYTTTPSRKRPETFSSDRDIRLEEDNLRIDEMNNTAEAINDVTTDINAKNTNVNNKHTDVTSKHSEVISARDTAVAKADEVKNLQLPTQATYTYEEFNKMLAATFEKAGFIYHHKPLIHPEDVFEKTNIPNTLRLKTHMINGFFDGDKIIDFGVDYIDIVFPEKPFAPTSTDELLDDKVHRLICQQAHNKGDFIVTGNELISNGNFKSGSLNWQDNTNGGTFEIVDSILHISTTSTSNEAFQSTESILIKGGITYVFTYRITDVSNGGAIFNSLTGGKLFDLDTSIGVHTHIYTVSSDTNFVFKIRMDGANNNLWICDISIRQKDTIYQAIKNTNEMFDIESSLTSYSNIFSGLVVKKLTSDEKGMEGFYLSEFDYGSNWNPNTENYTVGAWLYLGTTENMSLKNPYFEKRTKVTRRDFILFNKTTKTFQTFKGYKEFNVAAPDVNDFVEVYDEYSLVKQNVITDGIDEFVFIGVMGNCLNAGAYHFIYNKFGTSRYLVNDGMSARYWHETNELTSYTAFVKGIVSVNDGFHSGEGFGNVAISHPLKLAYDKVYIYSENGVGFNFLPLANRHSNLLELEHLKKYYINNGQVCKLANETYTVGNRFGNTCYFAANLKVDVYLPYKTASKNFKVGERVRIIGTNPLFVAEFTIKRIIESPDAPNDLISTDNVNDIELILGTDPSGYIEIESIEKASHISTYGSVNHADILGSKDDYLTEWKQWLQCGNSIVSANSLLIGQDETIYINGTYNPIGTLKLENEPQRIYTDDGNTWLTAPFNGNKELNILWGGLNNTAGRIAVMEYKGKNTLSQVQPKSIDYLSNEVLFQNCNFLYKGSNIVNSLGFISTANELNSLEIKPFKTISIGAKYTSKDGSKNIKYGDVILALDGLYNSGEDGIYYMNIGFEGTYNLSAFYYDSSNFIKLGKKPFIGTTPMHEPITANTTNSKAAKWFSAISKDYYQIFIKELAYNTTTSSFDGDNNKFDQLTNGTQTDLNGKKIKTRIVGVKLC